MSSLYCFFFLLFFFSGLNGDETYPFWIFFSGIRVEFFMIFLKVLEEFLSVSKIPVDMIVDIVPDGERREMFENLVSKCRVEQSKVLEASLVDGSRDQVDVFSIILSAVENLDDAKRFAPWLRRLAAVRSVFEETFSNQVELLNVRSDFCCIISKCLLLH